MQFRRVQIPRHLRNSSQFCQVVACIMNLMMTLISVSILYQPELANRSYNFYYDLMSHNFDEVTDEDSFFSWNKNIISTFYLEQQLSDDLATGGFDNWDPAIKLQKVGTDTIADGTFPNRLNTNTFTVSVGQFCMQAIRAEKKSSCGR